MEFEIEGPLDKVEPASGGFITNGKFSTDLDGWADLAGKKRYGYFGPEDYKLVDWQAELKQLLKEGK